MKKIIFEAQITEEMSSVMYQCIKETFSQQILCDRRHVLNALIFVKAMDQQCRNGSVQF